MASLFRFISASNSRIVSCPISSSGSRKSYRASDHKSSSVKLPPLFPLAPE